MPSPVGHALAGLAVGWFVADAPPSERTPASARGVPRSFWTRLSSFAALGMLADIDFLFGTHSTYTHSVGAMAIAGVASFLLLRRVRGLAAIRLAAAAALAYGSHILLDALGDDTTPPIGVMAFWPITAAFYQTDLHLFMAISRRYWLPGFWTHNFTAVLREIAILAPIACAVFALRRRR
jgi:membrane-bound metal-dependent hydrolase YbcI (DUF457 family)